MFPVEEVSLMGWFPQEYAEAFFYVKGFVGVIGTTILVMYMNNRWHSFESKGQRLRFITLLYFAVLITAASAEQVMDGVQVSLRNVGAFGGAVLLVYTVYVSVREDITRKEPANGRTN
jgi:hypothetical protein